MNHDIDIEMLISLVENKPVLWDKTLESYKNKQLNFTTWKEICKTIHDIRLVSLASCLELIKFNYKKWIK